MIMNWSTKDEFRGSSLSKDMLYKRINLSDWPRKFLDQKQAVKTAWKDLINLPFSEKPTHTQEIRIRAPSGIDILHI